METEKKIFSVAVTKKSGEIQLGDLCKDHNNGFILITTRLLLKVAEKKNYERIEVHILGGSNYESGDYVIEWGEVFGPVEEQDRAHLEDSRKILASSDKDLGLPLIPTIFLRSIHSINSLTKAEVEVTKIYNDGEGWKYTLLPSEWNDDVKIRETFVLNDAGEINVERYENPNCDIISKAFRYIPAPSDMPRNEIEWDIRLNEFLTQNI